MKIVRKHNLLRTWRKFVEILYKSHKIYKFVYFCSVDIYATSDKL